MICIPNILLYNPFYHPSNIHKYNYSHEYLSASRQCGQLSLILKRNELFPQFTLLLVYLNLDTRLKRSLANRTYSLSFCKACMHCLAIRLDMAPAQAPEGTHPFLHPRLRSAHIDPRRPAFPAHFNVRSAHSGSRRGL